MKWWVRVASNTGEIERHFTYSETRLNHKLNGSTLVGFNVKEVPLNEGLHKEKGIKIGHEFFQTIP